MPAEGLRPLRRSLFRVNKGMKLLSLVVAIVVWYGIRGAISFEAVLEDLPVHILLEEGWTVHEGAGQTVDVRFRGSRGDVQTLTRDQVRVTVDVRGELTPGRRTLSLSTRNVRAPSGARAVFIRPEQVLIRLDRESERVVPVRPEFQGQLPDGFEVERVICTPESVTVRAPSAQLDGLDAIRTVPVDLDGRIQSFRVRRGLVQAGAVRADPDRIQVEVVIREHAFLREISAVPVYLLVQPGDPPPVFSPFEVMVELQGRPEALRALDPGAVRAYVVAEDFQDTPDQPVPVRIHAPAGVRVVRVVPEAIRWEPESP